MKIGVAVTTTPNREHVFQEWFKQYAEISPELPLYIHNDINYKGVGYSKNKCLSTLYDNGCDYFFLFDDDCFIMHKLWSEYYIKSNLQHAAYTFDRKWITIADNYIEYEKPNGCMMFFTRACIDKVGGWDLKFKGYGYEHVNLSDRIFNAGLTPARYLDIKRPGAIFNMAQCESSFSIYDRMEIPRNEKLYKENFYSKEFKPFK